MHIDAIQLAVNLLDTLRQDDSVPMNVQDCITNALVLLDNQEGEDFYEAVRFAFEQIDKANSVIESIVSE